MKDLLITSIILVLLVSRPRDVNAELTEGPVAEMAVNIKDYINPVDQLETGAKCDFNVFYATDFCDPRFLIEIGSMITGPNKISEYQTLATKYSPKYKNSKTIHSVFSIKLPLDIFPDHLRFNITIVDVDSGNSYQKIQEFIHELDPQAGVNYVERLGRTTAVTLEVKITCNRPFRGPRCGRPCVPLEGVWECDPNTGRRMCSIACANGECAPGQDGAICVCDEGWHGRLCDIPDNIAASTAENVTAILSKDEMRDKTLSTVSIILITIGNLLALILIVMSIGLVCCRSTRKAKERRQAPIITPQAPIITPARDNPQYAESSLTFSQLMAKGTTTTWEPLPMRATNPSLRKPSMAAEESWTFERQRPQLRPSGPFQSNSINPPALPFNCDSVYEDVKEGDDGYEPLTRDSVNGQRYIGNFYKRTKECAHVLHTQHGSVF
ncbi:hypothetical protein SprV_0100178500 [Sparganum proliferum]